LYAQLYAHPYDAYCIQIIDAHGNGKLDFNALRQQKNEQKNELPFLIALKVLMQSSPFWCTTMVSFASTPCKVKIHCLF